jgi:hypothetical protein
MSKRTRSRHNGVTPIPSASARRSPVSGASTAGATSPKCGTNARSSNGSRRWNATSGSRSRCCAPATTTASAIAACSPISSRRAPPTDLDADDFDPPDPIVAVVVVHSGRVSGPRSLIWPGRSSLEGADDPSYADHGHSATQYLELLLRLFSGSDSLPTPWRAVVFFVVVAGVGGPDAPWHAWFPGCTRRCPDAAAPLWRRPRGSRHTEAGLMRKTMRFGPLSG